MEAEIQLVGTVLYHEENRRKSILCIINNYFRVRYVWPMTFEFSLQQKSTLSWAKTVVMFLIYYSDKESPLIATFSTNVEKCHIVLMKRDFDRGVCTKWKVANDRMFRM